MARIQHLPVYKATYDLLLQMDQAIALFPRAQRFSLGQKMRDEALEIIRLIYRANGAVPHERLMKIQSMQEHVQALSLFLRLSSDLRILPLKKYAHLIDVCESIGRQLSGWANHARNQHVT